MLPLVQACCRGQELRGKLAWLTASGWSDFARWLNGFPGLRIVAWCFRKGLGEGARGLVELWPGTWCMRQWRNCGPVSPMKMGHLAAMFSVGADDAALKETWRLSECGIATGSQFPIFPIPTL